MSGGLELLWPARFGAAIFDFDGTLAETAHLWRRVDEYFFSSRGLPFDEDASERLGALGFAAGAQWAIETYGLRESVEDICGEWNRLGSALYEAEVELRPGAAAYLTALRAAGIPLALATTNEARVLGSMRHVDVGSLFGVVVCGAEVTRGKDHPDIYLEAARRLGAEPSDCMVFEDILAGTRSAQSVGMRVCGVRCADPKQPWDALRATADACLESWEELAPLA